jgi:hypothetical protein
MTRRRIALAALPLACLLAATTAVGQMWWRRTPPGVLPEDRNGVPNWKIDDRFKHDVFTFVRVEYDSDSGYGRGFGRRRGWGGGWATDFPDSDLNFSFRLQQLTSMKVNPDPISLRLTDPRVYDYPFLYMIEPGRLCFADEEVEALRRYLLNGGFLMVDDFWGDSAWDNVHQQFKRVFPDREPIELPIEHEIFRCVYRLSAKPQVPSIHSWDQTGETYEMFHDGDSQTVHYRALLDDKGRIMVLFCHNTDLGDGWEREGEDPRYFQQFSEKLSYPMGINIVTYAMTH